jgi:hypothetical protein
MNKNRDTKNINCMSLFIQNYFLKGKAKLECLRIHALMAKLQGNNNIKVSFWGQEEY